MHPDCQRRGIGGRMIQALLEKLPVWCVRLVSDNADAQRSYRRLSSTPIRLC